MNTDSINKELEELLVTKKEENASAYKIVKSYNKKRFILKSIPYMVYLSIVLSLFPAHKEKEVDTYEKIHTIIDEDGKVKQDTSVVYEEPKHGRYVNKENEITKNTDSISSIRYVSENEKESLNLQENKEIYNEYKDLVNRMTKNNEKFSKLEVEEQQEIIYEFTEYMYNGKSIEEIKYKKWVLTLFSIIINTSILWGYLSIMFNNFRDYKILSEEENGLAVKNATMYGVNSYKEAAKVSKKAYEKQEAERVLHAYLLANSICSNNTSNQLFEKQDLNLIRKYTK